MTRQTDSLPVERTLEAIGSALESVAGPIGDGANELLGPVLDLMERGKRMRAHLLLAAHAGAGGGNNEAAAGVAAALELFQVAALIHDDVLDRSDTRRGLPSAHRRIEAAHREAAWLGDATQFGVAGAILAGDLAFSASTRALTDALAGLPKSIAAHTGERFFEMTSLCTAGQYLDVRLAAKGIDALADAREDVLTVMRSKTASYTTQGPFALGAALAGCDRATADEWAAAGVPLGIAFQLKDDLLGAMGSPEITGKPAGDDLKEGKITLLVVHALAHANASEYAALRAVFGNPHASDGQVGAAIEALHATGATAATESLVTAYSDDASARIAALAPRPDGAARLSALTRLVVDRNS